MFAFFKNDNLFGFWSNKIGDVFCEITIRNMKWDQSEVDLLYYPELNSKPDHHEFGLSKELIIKKKIVTQNEVVTTNEEGEEVVTVEDVVTFEVEKTIEPVVYMSNGIMLKPC